LYVGERSRCQRAWWRAQLLNSRKVCIVIIPHQEPEEEKLLSLYFPLLQATIQIQSQWPDCLISTNEELSFPAWVERRSLYIPPRPTSVRFQPAEANGREEARRKLFGELWIRNQTSISNDAEAG
jgi:hypothetical protein